MLGTVRDARMRRRKKKLRQREVSQKRFGVPIARWCIKYSRLPWELDLAETACMLGGGGPAEERGFTAAPLIAIGCTMMRKYHPMSFIICRSPN